MFHGGSAPIGGMAETVRSEERGVLEQRGFDVWLVNARETRNLPGRKSDVQESQWLLKLHTYGLLRKSFRPTPEIRELRTCWRESGEYVQQAGVCIQRMQKTLTEMNVQLATALSDLSGATGMKSFARLWPENGIHRSRRARKRSPRAWKARGCRNSWRS
jgi:hypothetical protein